MRVSGRDNTKPWVYITEKPNKIVEHESPAISEGKTTVVERVVEVVKEAPEPIISQAIATYSKIPSAHRWERTSVVKLPSRTLPAGTIVNAEDITGAFSYIKVYSRPVKSDDLFPKDLRPATPNTPRVLTLTATWRE